MGRGDVTKGFDLVSGGRRLGSLQEGIYCFTHIFYFMISRYFSLPHDSISVWSFIRFSLFGLLDLFITY